MSFKAVFQEMFATRAALPTTVSEYGDGFASFFPFLGTGNNVKVKTALKLSAVYNAVEQISNDVAKIPFSVYRKENGSRVRVAEHPADMLLSFGSKMYLTSYIERKFMTISLLLRGNSLSKINVDEKGNFVLDFINWEDVQNVKKVKNRIYYYVNGYKEPLLDSEVVHIKQFTFDGIVGVSVITYAAMQLGISMDTMEYSSTSVKNRGLQRGVIETDKTMTKKGGVIAAFQSAMSEADPTRVAVLDEGMKFKPIMISPKDTEIIAQSRFNIEDIARWFNIAPHKIKSLQNSTNNNIEQQTLDHATDTIQPLVTNFEQEFSKKLISDADRMSMYIKGNLKVLLRADIRAQAEYYSKAINWGWMDRNEVRALEEMNAVDGLEGPLTPLNMMTLEQLKEGKNINNGGNAQ